MLHSHGTYITILKGVGVDPGVDHCYAVKVISEVHTKGGRVRKSSHSCSDVGNV